MNDQNIAICKEIESHLNDNMESNARKLLERDQILQTELDLFEQTLLPNQQQHWNLIRNQMDNMWMYAKLGKMRLMDSDENVTKLFGDYQNELSANSDYDEAALQLNLEMHQPSGIGGIFKSLFMWKDTPEERVKENKQK